MAGFEETLFWEIIIITANGKLNTDKNYRKLNQEALFWQIG
jgi:hypothetical protein